MKFLDIVYMVWAVSAMGLAVQADIIPYSDDFSTASGVANWVSSGPVATSFSRSTNNRDDTGGDGVAGDGALYFNSVNSTPLDEAITLVFGGTMAIGEQYTLNLSTYNPVNSFNSYSFTLRNRTDDVDLVSTGFYGQNGGVIGTLERTLQYTALATDAGDQLEVRWLENHNNNVRDASLDVIQLTVVVPEPSGSALLLMGLAGWCCRRRRA